MVNVIIRSYRELNNGSLCYGGAKISSISVDDDGNTKIKFKKKNGKTQTHSLSMHFDFFSESGVTVKID